MLHDVTEAKNYCINLVVGSDSGDNSDEDALLDIFFNESAKVDKERLLDYLCTCASSIDDSSLKKLTLQYIHDLGTDEDAYNEYNEGVKHALIESLAKEHIDKDIFRLLTHAVYWQYYAVAVKKCVRNAGIVIDKTDYKTKNITVLDGNNNYQDACHELCLDHFNKNSNVFSFSKTPMLRLFLHKIRATCKKSRTKKKT